MTKEGSTKNVNFMTPDPGDLVLGYDIIHIVKMHYFFLKYCSLLPGIKQTKK